MVINNNLQAIRSVYAKTALNSTRSTAKTETQLQADDELVLSPTAKSFSATLQSLRSSEDDVRTDKVNYYEAQLASGTYNVDADALAAKMLATRF